MYVYMYKLECFMLVW